MQQVLNGAWTEEELSALREELGDLYAGRTVLVTGADGFTGPHLTEALLWLGSDVHAFVRATFERSLEQHRTSSTQGPSLLG